jgi:hypothetical protein
MLSRAQRVCQGEVQGDPLKDVKTTSEPNHIDTIYSLQHNWHTLISDRDLEPRSMKERDLDQRGRALRDEVVEEQYGLHAR